MSNRRLRILIVCCLAASASAQAVASKDLRITIPRRSELTPVQKLNREGVNAVVRHKYEEAESLFFKAYLYDPADPFTLNNLGYVSELQGQVDRAVKFYKLAAEQSCDAVIERSSAKSLNGKPMMDALGTLKNTPMMVNRMNVMSMELLSQDRGFEAEDLLNKTLAMDPQNPFTLNNLGVAEESTGDLESALKHYDEVAATRSMLPVVVTLNRASRGKPVSEVAAESAKALRKRMQDMSPGQIRAEMLAVRGVAATNRNDWDTAKKDFVEAYALDPESAFALNNLGYVEERAGNFETAKSYYARARSADDAGARIGIATQVSAQGQPLATVADESHQDMDKQLDAYRQEHRGEKKTYELRRRVETTEPAAPMNQAPLGVSDQPPPASTTQPALPTPPPSH
jgi:Flp pilus assembly protein TadD